MAKIWENLINILNRLPLGRTFIVAILLTVVAASWTLKLVLYRKVRFLDILLTVLLLIGFTVLDPKTLFFKNAYTCLFLIIALYSVYDFFNVKNIVSRGDQQLLNHLKNQPYDYYFRTNQTDKLIDASLSVLYLAGLKLKELRKEKSFNILNSYFDILKINQKQANDEVLLKFKNDYLNANQQFKTYKFTLEILVKDKIHTYNGLICPLYLGKKYLGKNVYLNKERMEILEELKTDLNQTLIDLEDAKGQMHLLMSLSEQVILYYDFQTKTYVASDLFCKYTGVIKKEYTFDDFINSIHPDDLDFYIKQAATVNSLSTTRLKYRFLVGSVYYSVVEEAIYLEKERGLISLLRIVLDEKSTIETNYEKIEENQLSDLDILKEKKPTALFEQTTSLLDVITGTKNDK